MMRIEEHGNRIREGHPGGTFPGEDPVAPARAGGAGLSTRAGWGTLSTRSARLGTVALAVLLAVGCGGDVRADDPGPGQGASQAAGASGEQASGEVAGRPAGTAEGNGTRRVINVEVATLEPGEFREEIRLTGVVRAAREVTVSAEEPGVVRELLVDRGRAVAEGEALVRVDDRILRSQLREAEARAALARESWERRRRLFEEDGVGSELQYLEARYQWEQAEATRETLRERVERSVIRAPFAGILEDRPVEVGSSVSPGTPVARIVQVNPLKVAAGVPERFADDIRRGAPARVTFDVLPGQDYQGTVGFVGATVSPRNRTFEIEVTLANPGGTLKPEMVASVEVLRSLLEDVVVVPQNALVRTEEGFVAFVVENGPEGASEGVARVRPLRLGASARNRVVVEDGLAPGDRLIVVGQQQVAEGDRVRVVRESPAPSREGAR